MRLHLLIGRSSTTDSCPWARLVEVGVVDANVSFFACLLDHYHVGQPVGVTNFMNEVGCQEFVDLFFDAILPFRSEAPFFLLDRPETGINIKLVSDYLRRDFGHV